MENFKKKRELMISILLMIFSSAMAVTLPSTSYTPYAGDEGYSSSSILSPATPTSVTLPKTSFSMLGDGTGWCTEQTPQTAACSSCCSQEYSDCISYCDENDPTNECYQECDSNKLSCSRYCDGGSLPLGSGLCMLLMALCYGGARVATSNISKGK